MQRNVAHETNDADEQILELLTEGRNLPQNLAERLDYSRQYVQNRLQMLKAADYVAKHGGGLYELTDSGREKIDAPTDDTATLRSRLQNAIEARDQAQVRAGRLETELEECRDELDSIRAQDTTSFDTESLRRALEDIETAAERGDGTALEDALRRAREAIE